MRIPPKQAAAAKKAASKQNNPNMPAQAQTGSGAEVNPQSAKASKQARSAKMPPIPPRAKQSAIAAAKANPSKQRAVNAPKSYAMVISSYENVARNNELGGPEADQLGETLQRRINLLNRNTQRFIEDLPEYKKLEIDSIEDLGDEIADMLTDDEEYLKAFALLKSPEFADLMEPKESVHRTFANMMQDHGEEQLLFGALDLINNISNPKKTPPEGPRSVNIKA